MPPEPPTHPEALVIRPSTGLVGLPEGGSPALSEIISRSLAHIQTSKALGMLHRIGEHELYGPDYRLVCALAQDLRLPPEEVLRRLLLPADDEYHDDYYDDYEALITEIEDARFKQLRVDWQTLPISSIPSIDCLVVELLVLEWLPTPRELDLSMFPILTELYCCGVKPTELELSQITNLKTLRCRRNGLIELDISQVPNLTELDCDQNQLTELDLLQVPNLTTLRCSRNRLRPRKFFSVKVADDFF